MVISHTEVWMTGSVSLDSEFIDETLWNKTYFVVSKCETSEQLEVSKRYAKLALRKHCKEEGYGRFCGFKMMLDNLINEQEEYIALMEEGGEQCPRLRLK